MAIKRPYGLKSKRVYFLDFERRLAEKQTRLEGSKRSQERRRKRLQLWALSLDTWSDTTVVFAHILCPKSHPIGCDRFSAMCQRIDTIRSS